MNLPDHLTANKQEVRQTIIRLMQIMLFQQVIVIIHTQFLLFLYLSIRNIYGELERVITTGRAGKGAFSVTQDGNKAASTGGTSYYTNISFNSSRVVSTGPEIRPYSVLALPIYIY